MPEAKTYLGDGVYASFDGFQIWLETEREEGQTERIALESEVYLALVAYVEHLKRETSDA